MSLTGSLEDLPLLDIIQIVSFSQRTGSLSIRADEGEAAIVFRKGLVVSAFTWDSLPLDPRAGALPADKREQLLRARLEVALVQLTRLRDGQFHFILADEPPEELEGRSLRAETLTNGINPQELLLNLARGIDEDRRDSSAAIEASFERPEAFEDELAVGAPAAAAGSATTPDGLGVEAPAPALAAAAPAPAEAPVRPPVPPRVLLADDEDDVRQLLALRFAEAGYNVEEAASPDETIKLAARLSRAGCEFVLVTDLGMPTSGGSSFQGGFEIVKRLWKMNLHPPVLLMTESLNPAVRARARQMGIVDLVFKPGLSRLEADQFEADLRVFADRLVHETLPALLAPKPKEEPRGGTPPAPGAGATARAPDELSRQFRLLQQRLEDLRRSGDAARVAVLIMKVAREFFERSLLFLVKNDELRGLGGFGPAPKGVHLNLLAREIAIPLGEPSVFMEAVSSHKPFAGPLPDGKWGVHLLGRIGRFRSHEIALFPLLTHRQTTAVLFGDNPETGRPFERLEALEVFVDQAGMALENIFLQRKLQSLQG